MTLPSINTIRDRLGDIPGALIEEPLKSTVDLGEIPHVPIHQPTAKSSKELSIPVDTESSDSLDTSPEEESLITFEIPPELDERTIKEALGQVEGGDFERLIKLSGIDALGWYFPFHYLIAQHGIYISSKGTLQLAAYCFKRKYSEDAREDLSKKIRYATHAILRHESFHFAVECMAANWELATGVPCYINANRKMRNQDLGYVEQEEALANAYMLRGFRWVNAATAGARATPSLKAFTKIQPPGYNRGADFVRGDRYEEGCRNLAFDYHEQMSVQWLAPRKSFDTLGLFPNVSRIDWRRCPVIMLDEGGLFAALGITPRFIDCVAMISETSTFRKQLDRLGSVYSEKWRAAKTKLKRSTAIPGLDFKPWPPLGKGWFSVRVDDNVRAHLFHHGATHAWSAETIGRHDVMGH
jgi:hypothetical protein